MKPDKRLVHTKIYIGNNFGEIAKIVKSLGYKFLKTYSYKTYEYPFWYFNSIGDIILENNNNDFQKSDYKEITFEELKSYVPKHEFKPFEKVLVRSIGGNTWRASIFSHYDDGSCVVITGYHYDDDHILPYEGNEHLLIND